MLLSWSVFPFNIWIKWMPTVIGKRRLWSIKKWTRCQRVMWSAPQTIIIRNITENQGYLRQWKYLKLLHKPWSFIVSKPLSSLFALQPYLFEKQSHHDYLYGFACSSFTHPQNPSPLHSQTHFSLALLSLFLVSKTNFNFGFIYQLR